MYLLSRVSAVLILSVSHVLRRQESNGGLTVAAICEKPCDDAAVQGEFAGEVSASLCPCTAPFQTALSACYACASANGASASPASNVQVFITGFNQFIDVCGTTNTCAANAILGLISQQSVAASLSSASAANAAVISSLDSLAGIIPSSTGTSASRASSTSHPITSVATAPPTAATSSINHSSNTGTVIGAAVGGSVGGLLLLALVIGAVIMRRKRHRKALEAAQANAEKPQLHSDDFKPKREELEGTAGQKFYDHTLMSELPSNEPVEEKKELPVNEVVGAELDNKVRMPKTVVSSQSTKVGSGT